MYGVARSSSGDTLIAYREVYRKPWQRGDGPIGFNISLAWTEGLGIVYIDHVASSSHSRFGSASRPLWAIQTSFESRRPGTATDSDMCVGTRT